MIITIDGPSGTGKSTAAKNLARRLGYLYLDTGAMYRAMALKALQQQIPLTDRKRLTAMANRTRIHFRKDRARRLKLILDGNDVTQAIRRPEVAQVASYVAVVPGLRRALVRKQRAMGVKGRVVVEGRDTGTVVFPDAPIKVYLCASLPERAKRRYMELKELGHRISLPQVLREARLRDRRDKERHVSPLRPAKGAIRIDNTRLQSPQVVDKIFAYVRTARRRKDAH